MDTIITIKKDTIPKYVYVHFHDTAFIENDLAKAKSYYDSTTQKIVLSLVGKPLSVPVTIYKIEKRKEIITKKQSTMNFKVILGLCVLILLLILWIKLFMKKK